MLGHITAEEQKNVNHFLESFAGCYVAKLIPWIFYDKLKVNNHHFWVYRLSNLVLHVGHSTELLIRCVSVSLWISSVSSLWAHPFWRFFLPSVRKSHGRACQARNPPNEVKPDPLSWSHFPYFLHSFLLLTFNWVATRVLSEDDQQPTLGIVIRIMQTLAWIKSNWTEQHELIRDKVVKRSHRVDSSGINPKCTKRMSLSWAIKLQIFDRQIALSSCKPIFLRNDQANLTHKRLSRSYKESKVRCESDPRSDWK